MIRPGLLCLCALLGASALGGCTRSGERAVPSASPSATEQPLAQQAAEVTSGADGTDAPQVRGGELPQEPSSPGGPTPTGARAPPAGDWTTRAKKPNKPAKTATLRAVRAAEHEGTDRVVFEFSGPLPGYTLEYIDSPVRHCASDNPIALRGEGFLEVRFEPARAHDEAGEVTVAKLRHKPDLPVVLELAATCDFEGVVTWVLGTRSPQPFRVLELASPTRLVIDLQQRR